MDTRFRLRKGDFEVEVAGSQAFVEDQLSRHLAQWLTLAGAADLSTEGDTTPKEDFPRVAADFRPKVNVTIGEFLSMKAAETPADQLVVAIYYLERYLQQDTFEPADLEGLLGPLPAWNGRPVAAELEAALARGHVEKLRNGRFTITYKGQNYVREGLVS